MKLKINDKETIFSSIEEVCLNSPGDKILLSVYEKDNLIAKIELDVSVDEIVIGKVTFMPGYESNPSASEELETVLKEIGIYNAKLKIPFVIDSLSNTKDLFLALANSKNAIHDFLQKNKEYGEFISTFQRQFATLSTPALQTALGALYKSADKSLITTYLSDSKNEALLELLINALPTFDKLAKDFKAYTEKEFEQFVEEGKTTKYRSNAFVQEALNNQDKLQAFISNTLQQYKTKFPDKYNDSTKTELPNEFLKNQPIREFLFHLVRNQQVKPDAMNEKPNLDVALATINDMLLVHVVRVYEAKARVDELGFSTLKTQSSDDKSVLGELKVDWDSQGEDIIRSLEEVVNSSHAAENEKSEAKKAIGQVFIHMSPDKITPEKVDYNKYGSDILLQRLQSIEASPNLNLVQKKAEAKKAVDSILPHITSNKAMLKLCEIIEHKHTTYAYLRQERSWWRLSSHGNTNTWSTILGKIKDQMDANVETCKEETYTPEEYEKFLRIMNEHRGRGFGSVTHSKLYSQIDEVESQSEIHITKKM
ncbi:hypothetical protein [Legionella cardiaca]|uniref:Uncharacterized protein n=1 Tax=Legionella cardiaca TaxID=1071983 RepID=A0ABY8ARP1_9GAMM|nr:hypothetical protein [Legionella cardiaca]WED41827.1 hypothetical protein PXX05_07735 [Legionella cardiaca]